VPFRLAGPAILTGVIDCANACASAYICPLGLLGTPEACYYGAAGVVLGQFRRSSRGTASETCRIWVPAAGSALASL
jgi:sulfite reductase beta subunit-like hemoprotein